MQELWTISGREPVNWTVPFYVEWKSNCALLTCGVALMARHRMAVTHLLSIHGERYQDKWVIKRGHLEDIGVRTIGGDPEMYFVWSAHRPESIRPVEGLPERSEMASAMFKLGIGESEEHAHVLWTSICRLVANRLINEEKPVDMFFFKLHNSPYRANWLTVVTQRISRRLRGHVEEEVSGFTELLLSHDLLSYNSRNRLCYRRVEVEHGTRWWKLATKVESERLKVKGDEGYADYFLDSVRRFYPVAKRIYDSWLAQIRTNSVACDASGPRGRIRFVSATKKKELSPLARNYCALPPVVSANPKICRKTLVSKTYGIVPSVSALRQASENVWESEGGPSRPDVDAAGGVAAANGVLLLPAGQKLA